MDVQIQTAISETNIEKVLPPIQALLRADSGRMFQKGWDIPSEGPELGSEETYSQKVRNNSMSELPGSRFGDEDGENTHDIL